MILRGTNQDVRCLVVDGDEGVRDFVLAILAREGIRAHGCADGREAAHCLRTTRWDLLLLDFATPIASGEVLLRLAHDGEIPLPRWAALTGSTRQLAQADGAAWTRKVSFLPKPFQAADVRAWLDQSIGRKDPLVTREVMIAGRGLWSDAIARVVSRRGGRAVFVREAEELASALRERKPAALAVGPPFDDAEIVRAIVMAREEAGTPVIAALKAKSEAARDLLAIGAAGVFTLPSDLPGLGAELMRAAGLRRVHSRAPLLAPVLCRTGRTLHAAIAFDVGEGGIGLEAVARDHGHGIAEVEFSLRGTTIVAAGEIAWLDDADSRARAGLRFTDVDDSSRERIRAHIRAWRSELTGEAMVPEPC